MAFDEVRFSPNINYGSAGGPGFLTQILELDSGAEERIARWSRPRRKYNAAHAVKSLDDLAELMEFYICRDGAARGFRWKDWMDFTTAANHRDAPANDDHQIGTGTGSALTFQLAKKYTSGAISRTRTLTKPVSSTVLVAVDSVGKTEGVDWSVNTTTGIITFTAAPSNGAVITAGCEFDVPVRFGQEADALLDVSIDAFDEGSMPPVPLVEIVDDVEIQDQFFFGGAKAHGNISANISISLLQGRLHTFSPQTTGLKVVLPATTYMPTGGPIFYLVNENVSNVITVVSSTYATVKVLAAQSFNEIHLGYDANGAKEWVVR